MCTRSGFRQALLQSRSRPQLPRRKQAIKLTQRERELFIAVICTIIKRL